MLPPPGFPALLLPNHIYLTSSIGQRSHMDLDFEISGLQTWRAEFLR